MNALELWQRNNAIAAEERKKKERKRINNLKSQERDNMSYKDYKQGKIKNNLAPAGARSKTVGSGDTWRYRQAIKAANDKIGKRLLNKGRTPRYCKIDGVLIGTTARQLSRKQQYCLGCISKRIAKP